MYAHLKLYMTDGYKTKFIIIRFENMIICYIEINIPIYNFIYYNCKNTTLFLVLSIIMIKIVSS